VPTFVVLFGKWLLVLSALVINLVLTSLKKERKYDVFLNSITDSSVFVIDEMGYFNMNEEEVNHFFQIISKRLIKITLCYISTQFNT
jgi:DNA replication protein DnaC